MRCLRGGIDDVRNGRIAEPAETQPEVERSTEHHDEIRALLQQPTGAKERKLVVGGQHAASEPVEETRHP